MSEVLSHTAYQQHVGKRHKERKMHPRESSPSMRCRSNHGKIVGQEWLLVVEDREQDCTTCAIAVDIVEQAAGRLVVDDVVIGIECGSGTYVRSLIADLGDAYCLELRRTGIGPFDVADAGRSVPLGEALGFLPAVELAGEEAKRAGHGVAVPGSSEGTVRLVDGDGLIALAEPREDGTLKPVVGFRG